MRAITLTSPQQTQAKANQTAIQTAKAALAAAITTQTTYLQTAAGLSSAVKVQLSDDGTMVICS